MLSECGQIALWCPGRMDRLSSSIESASVDPNSALRRAEIIEIHAFLAFISVLTVLSSTNNVTNFNNVFTICMRNNCLLDNQELITTVKESYQLTAFLPRLLAMCISSCISPHYLSISLVLLLLLLFLYYYHLSLFIFVLLTNALQSQYVFGICPLYSPIQVILADVAVLLVVDFVIHAIYSPCVHVLCMYNLFVRLKTFKCSNKQNHSICICVPICTLSFACLCVCVRERERVCI